jgi:stage V sporulation protein S
MTQLRNLAYDDERAEEDIIRVGGGTDPQSIAYAISTVFHATNEVTLRAMGAGAVNQAVKAIAIARGYVATSGVDLIVRPGFINVPDNRDGGEPISAIVFRLSLR